jgi:hypothetical protein
MGHILLSSYPNKSANTNTIKSWVEILPRKNVKKKLAGKKRKV